MDAAKPRGSRYPILTDLGLKDNMGVSPNQGP